MGLVKKLGLLMQLLVIVIVAQVALGGCIASSSLTQGANFFNLPPGAGARSAYSHFLGLEAEVVDMVGQRSLEDLELFLMIRSIDLRGGDAPVERRATFGAMGSKVVTKTWRLAVVNALTVSAPLYSKRSVEKLGFSLQATEQGGKIVKIETHYLPLTEGEKKFSTEQLVGAAIAAGATFFLLSPP